MAQKLNILITSAGRRVGLVECFRSAARELEIDLTIFACDLDPNMSAACQSADKSFPICRCTDDNYIPNLLTKVQEHGIHFVIPTIDPELTPLALSVQKFRDIGAEVHISSPNVIDIVRDKLMTSDILAAAGVAVPKTALQDEIIKNADTWTWPIFAKPSGGSASRGLQIIERVEDIAENYEEPMIFQEYLQGPEYTINIFIDQNGKLQAVIPHLRIQTRAGEVEKGITVRNPDFHIIAQMIAKALPGARGVLCFQLIVDPNLGAKVFEINARFGGGYPLADHAGGKFAKWLLAEVSGQKSKPNNNWRDGVEMMRYDSAIYRG